MAGHGSPPAENKANHPGRQVGRIKPQVPLTQDQRDSRHLWDEDWAAEGRALNAEPRDYD